MKKIATLPPQILSQPQDLQTLPLPNDKTGVRPPQLSPGSTDDKSFIEILNGQQETIFQDLRYGFSQSRGSRQIDT